jgi:hypothetical protein
MAREMNDRTPIREPMKNFFKGTTQVVVKRPWTAENNDCTSDESAIKPQIRPLQ